jgi:hypothetical protein
MNTPKKSNKKQSPELQARIDRTRTEAHKDIVAAGKIQFRLDSETMELLLRTADARGTGAGVLARMWVVERLKAETSGALDPVRDLDRRLRIVEDKIARYNVS